MKKLILFVTLMVSGVALHGQTSQNAQPIAKPEAATEVMSSMRLASDLVKYGNDNQQALPLVQALQIMKTHPMAEGDFTKAEGTTAAPQPKDGKLALNYNEVLAQAKALARGNSTMLALIDQVDKAPVAKGRTVGALCRSDRVNARSTDTWNIRFQGGSLAEVLVSGDGDTDLDLFVYDENGNLIVSDTDSSDDCYVRWTPSWTGNFRVKVKNLGSVYNNYLIMTN